MNTVRMIALLVAITAAAAAGAQTASTTPNQDQRGERRLQLPPNAKAVKHNGRPALEFEGNDGWGVYILLGMHQGEPALGFAVAEGNCQGTVYVTRTRVTGEFPHTTCQNFDIPRESASLQRRAGNVMLTSGSSTYLLTPQAERDTQRQPMGERRGGTEILPRTIKNFDPVFRNMHRLVNEAQQKAAAAQPAQPSTRAAAKSSAPDKSAAAAGMLTITSDPGDVQVYVNDEPRGMTSEEGEEVLRLPPGAYRVRLSLPGYKDSEQQVTLAAGKPQQLKAKLEPSGPPPFSDADVSEMLEGKMSPKRISTLVQERGVDFQMTSDLEKKYRSLGATSDLLLVIAENKKK